MVDDLVAPIDEVDSEIAEIEDRMADTHAWARDLAGQQRVRELYKSQESGAPVPAKPTAHAKRLVEIEAAMGDGSYWRDGGRMQDEYAAILRAEESGQVHGEVPPEVISEWSKSLQVSHEEMSGAVGRSAQIVVDLGGTSAGLDMAFEGLPDTLQHSCLRALARPNDRVALIQALSSEDREQLQFFLNEGITDSEHAALEKALGL